MNTIAYVIYLLLTFFITVYIGLRFYRHGRVYILSLFSGDHKITDSINKILLAGYYLLNLGYVALMLRSWDDLHSWNDVVTSITSMTGRIILLLAVIHYFNMACILYISRHKSFLHHKNTAP